MNVLHTAIVYEKLKCEDEPLSSKTTHLLSNTNSWISFYFRYPVLPLIIFLSFILHMFPFSANFSYSKKNLVIGKLVCNLECKYPQSE